MISDTYLSLSPAKLELHQPKTKKGMIKISYRDKFIKSVKEKYSTETEAYRRREKAENLIYEYFGDLLEDLYDETEAADEKLEIEYDKIKLNGIELGFDYEKGVIKVFTLKEGSTDKEVIDQLDDNGEGFFSINHDAELSDDLLDIYLKKLNDESTGSEN